MGVTVHSQKTLDVICQHKKDGNIIPLKIRLQDEDGEYQAFSIKSYRCTNLNKAVDPMHNPTLFFECKIIAFGQERLIGISFSFHDGLWKIIGHPLY